MPAYNQPVWRRKRSNPATRLTCRQTSNLEQGKFWVLASPKNNSREDPLESFKIKNNLRTFKRRLAGTGTHEVWAQFIYVRTRTTQRLIHSHRSCGWLQGYDRPEKWLAGSDWMVSSSSRFGSQWGRATTLSSTHAISVACHFTVVTSPCNYANDMVTPSDTDKTNFVIWGVNGDGRLCCSLCLWHPTSTLRRSILSPSSGEMIAYQKIQMWFLAMFTSG